MTEGSRAEEAPLDEGLALLEEQRLAMLARDAERLDEVNARLSAWIAACRHVARDADPTARLLPLRVALDANAALARRSALQASRGLGALLGPDAPLYTEEGLTPAPAHRREARSA